MIRDAEIAAPAAAIAVVVTALLGGAFSPGARLVVGLVLIVVWVVAGMTCAGRLDRIEWGMALLLAWGVVSAATVGAAPLASKEALTTWLIACTLWGASRRTGERGRRCALQFLAAGGVIVAAGVIGEALVNGLRVGGVLENPNVAAALIVPTLPVGMEVLESRPRWRWTWLVLMTVGVVLTGSRAGLLALVVVVGILLPKGRLRLAGVLVGFSVVSGVLAWRFVSQPDVLAWHRISIWWAVLKIWLARPLTGVGPGGLVEAAGTARIFHGDEIGHYQFVIGYAESSPLAILVQLGLVGAVLALLIGCAWFYNAKQAGRLGSRSTTAYLSSIVVLSLFHDLLTIDPVLWWWAVLVGCLVGRSDAGGAVSSNGQRRFGNRAAAVVVLSWLTAWGLLTPSYARLLWSHGESRTEDVVRALRAEPWFSTAPAQRAQLLLQDPSSWDWSIAGEALQWAQAAVRTQPGLARRWADLGRVHLRIITDLGGTEHDVQAARLALERACDLDPCVPWNWLELARLEWRLGNLESASRLIRTALDSEPNTVRGWLFLGRIELARGRLNEAGHALREAERALDLADRPSLSEYERELLFAPTSELKWLRQRVGPASTDNQSSASIGRMTR